MLLTLTFIGQQKEIEMNFLKKIFKLDPEVDYQYALREDMNGNYKKAYWLFEKAAQNGLVKAQFVSS